MSDLNRHPLPILAESIAALREALSISAPERVRELDRLGPCPDYDPATFGIEWVRWVDAFNALCATASDRTARDAAECITDHATVRPARLRLPALPGRAAGLMRDDPLFRLHVFIRAVQYLRETSKLSADREQVLSAIRAEITELCGRAELSPASDGLLNFMEDDLGLERGAILPWLDGEDEDDEEDDDPTR